MKKLKLRLDGMKEMLTREQMKKIEGGYSQSQCQAMPYQDCLKCMVVDYCGSDGPCVIFCLAAPEACIAGVLISCLFS